MPSWTRETILRTLESERESLHQMGVQRIGLFGSYARNQQHETSDIDLLVTLDPFTFETWMDVWNHLEALFECKIDLIPEKDLREELQLQILAEVQYVQVA